MIHKITRHKIYKYALESHRENKAAQLGLCSAIADGIYKYGDSLLEDIDPYHDMSPFPEIIKHRPKKYIVEYFYCAHWFPCTNWQKREDILIEAIELTKVKKRK